MLEINCQNLLDLVYHLQRPKLDIDMTDHGNSKEHPIVPHYHNWCLDENNTLKREAKHDNALKLGHEIANKDILEKR